MVHTLVVLRHGNSLRALVKYLENISDDEIPLVGIPTGDPLVHMPDDGMNAVGHRYPGGGDWP